MLITTEYHQSFWVDMADSKFFVCPLTGTEEHKIDAEHTTMEAGRQVIDVPAIRAEKFCKVVKDWTNVNDLENKEVKYTDNMRDKFADFNPDFAELVIQKARHRILAKEKEENESLGKQ